MDPAPGAINDVSNTNDDDQRNSYLDEDDEDECRVCRGPAEEGRPLLKPCMCSGSIGLVHQDCLESWLKVQRRDGSCELCKTKFRFAPQYAENTPDCLPIPQIITSLCRRAVARWLPLTIRSLFAASLWLIVAPLITAYIYHSWMARPSAILERFTWNLLTIDLISGAVVAACILVSFLSLMSFADFLRGEWQQRGLFPRRRGAVDRNQPNNNINNIRQANRLDARPLETNPPDIPRDEDVDNSIWEHVQNQVLQQPNRVTSPRLRRLVALERELDDMTDNDNEGSFLAASGNKHDKNVIEFKDVDKVGSDDNISEDSDENDSWNDDESSESSVDENDNEDFVDEVDLNRRFLNQGNRPILLQQRIEGNMEGRRARDRERIAQLPPNPEGRGGIDVDVPPNNPPVDFEQEDPIDMDINIALDELLGVRGPLLVVARNLLWLLAFNGVFLGFFAFVPRTVGIAMSSILFNTTLFSSPEVPGNSTDDIMKHFNISQSFHLNNAWKAIEAESIHQNTALRLHDIATVALGYFSLAFAVIFFRFLWVIAQKVPFLRERRARTVNPDTDEMREAIDEMNRIVQGLGNDARNIDDDPPVIALSLALGVALDAMLAIVKVGILLFIKMFLLPIILGLTLDGSTIPLFGSTLEARIAYAGKDLFSFILLHWVAGITFMLLVTVSVLQLREVAHPDLLAQMIRPQEPQPDLLGNLMHESISTHAKRMILSLIIYAFLLTIHIYFPVRFFGFYYVVDFSFFNIKLAYTITPQLQVPIELIFFHLCMLALLEKYKNGLGGLQHHWLKLMSEILGLSDRILPQTVECFCLIGTRAVFINGSSVDNFWFDLSKAQDPATFLESHLATFSVADTDRVNNGAVKPSGERVIRLGSDFIRLPVRLPGKSFRARSTFLPTKIGEYRLAYESLDDMSLVIQLWKEVPGMSIKRPPEGWDDLGAGGADVQGRWAWGSEKKSTIEGGIAARRPLFDRKQSIMDSVGVGLKLLFLGIVSWLATTIVLCLFLTIPLIVGRSIYYILQVPEKWIHDPMAFGIGFLVTFPLIRKVARVATNSQAAIFSRLSTWMSLFRWPSIAKCFVLAKTIVLWFFLAPLLLGFLYEIALLKSPDWFIGNESFTDRKSILINWTLGSLLLYAWGDLCIMGVLTKDFRIFREAREAIGQGDAANAEAAAWLDIGGGRLRLSWQGKHGRLARFWDTFTAIFTNWEWDKVDEVNLVHNCAKPVTQQLLYCVLFPLTTQYVVGLAFPMMSGLSRAIFARSVLVIYCSVQICRVWHDQIRLWLDAAHKTARDDRYLIGEILLNYGE